MAETENNGKGRVLSKGEVKIENKVTKGDNNLDIKRQDTREKQTRKRKKGAK